jgi:hypothetical protein
MAFVLRPYRRVPVVCPVTYERGLPERQGTVWNLSPTGWRIGTQPLQCGDVCAFRVVLPTHRRGSVAVCPLAD